MTPEVVRLLACPVCGGEFGLRVRSLVCQAGHGFDVARQGYVNLVGGAGVRTGTGDTPEMVDARLAFLGGGHFDPISRAVTEAVRARAGAREAGVIVDLGAGTGHHLAAALAAVPAWIGLALDVSKHAARAAARAHPRIGAVVCDVWDTLPVRAGVADVVLDIFAPRNPAEVARILGPGGAFVLVTPTAEHLRELVPALGLVAVDPGKSERLARDLAAFTLQDRTPVRFTAELGHDDIRALVGMGPTARHLVPRDLDERLVDLPARVRVECSVDLSVYSAPA